jgi:hypothetical protein
MGKTPEQIRSETRADAIKALERDIDILDTTIRMLVIRGCKRSVRMGLMEMRTEWYQQMEEMEALQNAGN